jgi:hypothetical protein
MEQENADDDEIRRLKEETRSELTRQGHADQDEIDKLNQETRKGGDERETTDA